MEDTSYPKSSRNLGQFIISGSISFSRRRCCLANLGDSFLMFFFFFAYSFEENPLYELEDRSVGLNL